MLERRHLLTVALSVPAIAQRTAPPDLVRSDVGIDGGSQSQPASSAASAEHIRAALSDQIDNGQTSVGYVAAIAGAGSPAVVAVGRSGSSQQLSGDSLFEIGSITKVFTALLLADMVVRGEVAFDDPAAKYLPRRSQPRPIDGQKFLLTDLATHTSGLPRNAANLAPKNQQNPYAEYTDAMLYEFLSGFTPTFYPGEHYLYSNLGFMLLGHILSLRAGRSYEELVVSRICDPLGLNDTRVTLTPAQAERLVPGHDPALNKVTNWDQPLPGAGAIKSTANDLIRFINAAQGRTETRLRPAFESMLSIRRTTGNVALDAAIGWFVQKGHQDELVAKDGATGGYAAFAGYSARSEMAAVLLSNTRSWITTLQLGRYLLNSLFDFPPLRPAMAINPSRLAAYAGRYDLTPLNKLELIARDGYLVVKPSDQKELETDLFPESDTRFFMRETDATATFEMRQDGSVSHLVLRQYGQSFRMPRR
jgi:serine-type D-Ala-D-Ala carboxypeptidase/endopeptidase